MLVKGFFFNMTGCYSSGWRLLHRRRLSTLYFVGNELNWKIILDITLTFYTSRN